MGLVQGPEALSFLHERGFPALLIAAGDRPRMGQNEAPLSVESVADGLYAYALSLKEIPEAADRRYFFFSVGRRVIPLPEGLSVALFALITALGLGAVLSYSLTHRHLLIARGMVFLRRSWAPLLFLAILFVCLLSAGFAVSFILRSFGATAETARYGAAALKFTLALALYSVAAPFFTRRPVPRRAHFYGTIACFLLAGGCFIAALIDFTFVPLFLWAFVVSLAASVVHTPSATFALAGLAPLQILLAAAAAIGSREAGPARILLSEDVWINLFFAFALLPFLMLFRRAAALSRSRAGASQEKRALYSRILFFAGTILAVLSYANDTAAAERRMAVPVRERMEATSSGPGRLSLQVASTTFLDRRTLRINLRPEAAPKATPVRLDLSFESEESVSIYDAPVPWVLSADGKKATLSLGERPAMPLEIELTLPLTAKGTLRAAALYVDPAEGTQKEGVSSDYALIVDTSVAIGGDT
jgi:hypothetical protein